MNKSNLKNSKFANRNFSIATVASLLIASFSLTGISSATAASSVSLGKSSSFAVLAGAGFNNSETSTLQGNLGVYPLVSYIDTGLLTINGSMHFGDSSARAAISDASSAYRAVESLTSTASIAAELGGTTRTGGVYQSATGITLNGTLILDGQNNPNTLFIFKAPGTFTTSASSRVTLINGAQACNVYWQVGQNVLLGSSSELKGNVLANSSFRSERGALLSGRVFAHQGSVSLVGTSITKPACLKYIGPSVDPSSATQILASGSGDYVTAEGKAKFAMNLRSRTVSETATPVVTGTLSWSIKDLWSFIGKFNSYSFSNGVGRATGSGALYYWGRNTNYKMGKKSGWIRATTNGANVEVLFLTPALSNPASSTSTRVKSFAIGFTGTKLPQIPSLPVLGALNNVED